MKKKLSLMLCLIMMVLSLSACGIDKESFDFYGLTYQTCEDIMRQNVEALSAMPADEMTLYQANADEVYAKLFAGWSQYAPQLGAYQGLGEFTLDKAQDTMTLEQIVLFENRELCVTFVFEYNYETKQVEITDTNADLVYTMGEKMEKAGLNTLMGMGTVFVMLGAICVIIYCFKFINKAQNKNIATKVEEPKTEVAAPVVQADVNLASDMELVAAISAAIAAYEGTTTDSFVVRSIRRR